MQIARQSTYLLIICLLILCGAVPQEQTVCQKAVQDVGGAAAPPGTYVPQCDDRGEFTPLQFHASTGHSWCVTREGNEIPGTRTPADKPPPTCQPFTGRTVLHTTSFKRKGSVFI